MAKAGRKTKFTPDRIEKILEGLRNGMTRQATSAYAHIHLDTFLMWLKQPSKAEFRAQVEEAENIAEARYTGVIAKAAFGHEVVTETTIVKANGDTVTKREVKKEYDWKAALEWLKRRRRSGWGDHVDVSIDQEIEQLIEALRSDIANEEQVAEESNPTIH